MPYLSKKRVWTGIPQSAPVLADEFSKGFVWTPFSDPRVFSSVSATTSGVSKGGALTKFSAVTDPGAVFRSLPLTGVPFTVIWGGNFTASGSQTPTVFSQRNGAAPYNQVGVAYNTNEFGALDSGIMVALIRSDDNYVHVATGFTDGYQVSAAAWHGGFDARIFTNGVRKSTGSTTSGSPQSTLNITGQQAKVGGTGDYSGSGGACVDGLSFVFVINEPLSDEQIARITRRPSLLFKTLRAMPLVIPSAGGGVHTTTGILTSDVATISGTSLHKILHTVVGNLTSSAATLTGTSVHTTPSPTHNTVGVLSASNSSIIGIAARYREHQTTGILTTTNATINGTTNNFSVITSTGFLSSDVATLAGVMSITPAPGIHISTGVLQSNSSTITGILTHTATGHTLTGTLVSSVATLNGNVAHNTIHSSSGTLVSSVATINGTASSSGIVTLTPADIEAIANAVWQHPWALTLPKWLALK